MSASSAGPEPRPGRFARFARIAAFELRALAADLTLAVLALLFLGVLGLAAANGARFAEARARTVGEIVAQAEADLAQGRAEVAAIESGRAPAPSPFADPRSPWRVRVPAVLPPHPLAALAIGQSDLLPYAASINLFTVKHALFANYEVENPLQLLSGRFDLGFALLFLFPLLILAFSYDVLAGERERGTLALSLAQPVSLGTLVLAKFAARAALVVGLGVGVSFGSLALRGAFAEGALAGHGGRLALWAAVIASYGLFWLALALGVNAFGRSPAGNATALFGLWIVLALVVPSLLSAAVERREDAPSRMAFVAASRQAENATQKEGEKLLAKYYFDHPELSGEPDPTDFSARYYAVRLDLERRLLPLARDFDQALLSERRALARFRLLSPTVVAHDALLDLAGTGYVRHGRYVAQVEGWVDRWRSRFAPGLFRREPLRGGDLATLPRFAFVEEDHDALVRRSLGALGSILGPTLLLGVLGIVALRRFRVVA